MFDNSRVVAGNGIEAPAKFSTYAYPLLQFSRENKFKYPAKPWPADAASVAAESTSCRERGGMTDFLLVAWVSALIETAAPWLDVWTGQALDAGRKAEAALCRIQRHAQYRQRRARAGNAAANPPCAGRGKCRFQRDDAEFRPHQGLFRRHDARFIFPTCIRRFCSAKSTPITAWFPAKARCSKANSPTR